MSTLMNIRRWLTLLTVVLLSMILFACAGNGDSIEVGNQPEAVTGADTASETDAPSVTGKNLSVNGKAKKKASFDTLKPGFTTSDDRVGLIEINQSLSYGFNTDTGEFYPMENFVAGKETAVFVTLNDMPDLGDDIVTLNIERNGEFIISLLPYEVTREGNVQTVTFLPKNMADVGNWEQGGYSFEFEWNDVRAVRTTNFYESVSIKILAVPILANYSGQVIGCEDEWKSSATMLYATYPVAKANVEYVLGAELDLSDDMYDLNDEEDGMYNVWEALANLQTPNEDYELIIGFIRENAGNGRLCGYTYGLPANIVTESDSDMLATVVHEVAHCYSIGDEYEGGSLNVLTNTPPYGMEGHDINSREPSVGRKEKVIGGDDVNISGSGTVIYPEQRAYWVEGRRPLGSVTSYMGSGTGADSFSMWTTSDIWNHLYSVFVGQYESGGGNWEDESEEYEDTEDEEYEYEESIGQCPECYSDIIDPVFYVECVECWEFTEIDDLEYICEECGEWGEVEDDDYYIECDVCWELISNEAFEEYNWDYDLDAKAMTAKEAQTVKAIDITGYLDKNGAFVATPWYTYETEATGITTRKNGAYGVYFFDADGGKLGSSMFDINPGAQHTTTEGNQVFVEADKQPVNVTVRFPENAAKIELRKGEQVLYTTTVSDTAPSVAFTGLTEDQELSDRVTLTWEAQGAPDRQLYFELWYCPWEDEFYNVASNITGDSYEVDLSKYPGTKEGYFYIYATDGVRTGEAASEWVATPFKAPEIITGQKEIPQVKITQEIYLDAEIYDMQDGWLWDEGVSWTLNGKEYMDGSALWVWPYELAPGTHTFSLTAVNSDGVAATKDFSFHIIDDESDLPDDWSRDDIINALSNGFVLPLSKPDAPVTRGQYATLMSNLYGTVSDLEEPYPDYEENLVVDCGQDDYDQFLMVKLGVMEAPGGRFEPNKPLSQLEAACIMYKVIGAADEQLIDIDADDGDIIEICSDNDIFDAEGPNVYSQDNHLTGRLALVRLSRLYELIFG